MTTSENRRLQLARLARFSLRSLLCVMALVAAYAAGWKSHQEWDRRHQAINGPVQIQLLEGTDVFVTRGRKEDVEKVTAIIDEIENPWRGEWIIVALLSSAALLFWLALGFRSNRRLS